MRKNTSELLGQLKIDREEVSDSHFSRRSILLAACTGIAGGVVLGGAITASFLDPEETQSAPASFKAGVQTAVAPEPQSLPIRETVLNASGYITARRMATVSSEVMGLITSVDVEEGMRVTEGQVLARLDDSKARVNLNFALAQVKVLQAREASIIANLEEARRQYLRHVGLSEKQYSRLADLTQSEAAVQRLEAELASARADIEVAKIEIQRQKEILEDHTIRAPFSGVVTKKNAQPGEIVAPSSAGGGFTRTGICTIVDMDSLEIEVDVNEAFIGRVSPGQKVIANLDAYPDWDIPATVEAIIPTADRAKATVRVRIRIDVKDSRILPDMGVKVAFLNTAD